MNYKPIPSRYDNMKYNRCGRSGIRLSAISLGLWHNFGDVDDLQNARKILHKAFSMGITHFDLANNYGPPPGSAERNFGKIFKEDFSGYRDECIISSKAGYYMWPGPYGDGGSRKYLISSIDQSLKRLKMDYVDIFYHHRPDTETPLEETMYALDQIVRQGKALYVGLSNYSPEQTREAAGILNQLKTPCLIHQPKYNMFERHAEQGLLITLDELGIGCIAFSPLAQGLLTDRYLEGIPKDSRVAKSHGFLKREHVSPGKIATIRKLNELAQNRGQKLAQMAIAWLLRKQTVTSVLLGVSKVRQLESNITSLENLQFSNEELIAIDKIT